MAANETEVRFIVEGSHKDSKAVLSYDSREQAELRARMMRKGGWSDITINKRSGDES